MEVSSVLFTVVPTHPLVAWGWAELLHGDEKRYENLREVRDEIQKETNRIAGVNKVGSTHMQTLLVWLLSETTMCVNIGGEVCVCELKL